MKALSIKQPWAWLICKGYKDVENRTWKIGRNPRHGPFSTRDVDNFTVALPSRIYVHAGKQMDLESYMHIQDFPENYGLPDNMQFNDKDFALGAIIGEVDITDCKFRFPDENDNLYSKWAVPGQWGFVLANPVLYDKPIPCRGQLGFFNPDLPSKPESL